MCFFACPPSICSRKPSVFYVSHYHRRRKIIRQLQAKERIQTSKLLVQKSIFILVKQCSALVGCERSHLRIVVKKLVGYCWASLSITSSLASCNTAKNAGSTTYSDSSTWQRPSSNCKHDKSNHSGTRLRCSTTSAVLSESCSRIIAFSGHCLIIYVGSCFRMTMNYKIEFEFFDSKSADFYKRRIEKLPEC